MILYFVDVKKVVLDNGVFGVSILGVGLSVFVLCKGLMNVKIVVEKM